MVVFKNVKKPVIKSASSGAEVSPQRPAYVEKTAPCISYCPNGNQVRDWLVPLAQFAAYGRTQDQAFEAAWQKITERNPFPAICGRVCQHPCENFCNRKQKDGGVHVHEVERSVGDSALAAGWKLAQPDLAPDALKVAIVGAGPAGLSCAYHLRRLGYQVTLFDAAPLAGGMMRYRIPRSVIPADILDGEIGNILGTGIELRAHCTVGQDITLADIKRDYRAAFFAMGLQKAALIEVRRHEDGAITAGELPAEAPFGFVEPVEVEAKALNTVSLAIAQGRAVAEAFDASLQNRTPEKKTPPPVIKNDHMKLDWYPAIPRHTATRTGEDGTEQAVGFTPAEAIEEAKRCLSCGMCMDCETCWMYCTSNCFVKLPKGEHYKIKLELCNGCKKCADACPCGFIDMN